MSLQKYLRVAVIFLAGVTVGLATFRWILSRRTIETPAAIISPTVEYHPRKLSEFTFLDRTGKKIGSTELKGQYWIADFFFTRCMGPCPLLTHTMAKLHTEFKDRPDLKFVSFTVDPEYDTPKVLNTYAELYGADKNRWYFLRGDKTIVYKLITDGFQLAVGPDETDPIQVVHSLSFVLIGKQGEILGRYNTNEPEMLAELRQRLRDLPQ